MKKICIDGSGLKISDVVEMADCNALSEVTGAAWEKVAKSRKCVQELLDSGRVAYGINTGFGSLASVTVGREDLARLQENIIKSHAVSVGEPYPKRVVRAAMILRLNALAKGFSGIREETLRLLEEMINRGVHPVVPRKGSLGASGDLSPLSHVALVMTGSGEAEYSGELLPGDEALTRAGLKPVSLREKEGLALINGTQFITAVGCLMCDAARRLAGQADLIGAATLEALKGTYAAFDPRVGTLRAHPGQIESARRLRACSAESEIYASHTSCGKVQDAYTLRCMPQVHGASMDVIEFCAATFEREINSVTDNPLIFSESGEVISAGNFHGQPIAMALDFLAVAVAELASISERRIERLVNPALSELPPFLIRESGLNSGFMIMHYTAAHLVSENKVLCHPASVDSIPTSANKEDHVSMGGVAANKLITVVENAETVLAIEALCACQGLDFHAPLRPGLPIRALHGQVRSRVPHLEADRYMRSDLETVREMMSSGGFDPIVSKL